MMRGRYFTTLPGGVVDVVGGARCVCLSQYVSLCAYCRWNDVLGYYSSEILL